MNDLILSSEGYELLKTALDNYKTHDKRWFFEERDSENRKAEWARSVFTLAAAVEMVLGDHVYVQPEGAVV